MRLVFALLTAVLVIGTVSCGNSPECLDQLRDEVQADVTRLVAVFLVNKKETFARNAQDAARRTVEKERLAQGHSIVEPVAAAVEASVIETFENLSWDVRRSVRVFLQTALDRLCTLNNCCFT